MGSKNFQNDLEYYHRFLATIHLNLSYFIQSPLLENRNVLKQQSMFKNKSQISNQDKLRKHNRIKSGELLPNDRRAVGFVSS